MAHYVDTNKPLEYSTHENQMRILGFWIFLGAEIVLFSTLFASYFVYVYRPGSGPTTHELFEMKSVYFETFILLTSSFTIGLAINSMRLKMKKATIFFLSITLLLGLSFLGIEIAEFRLYIHEGATIPTSAFLSALFLLLGTHGAHVTFGLFWGIGIIIQLLREGFSENTANKTFIFSLYWHFLDVVWIFIFTFVYVKGLL